MIDLFCIFVEIEDVALLAGVLCSSWDKQGRDYFLGFYLRIVAFSGEMLNVL